MSISALEELREAGRFKISDDPNAPSEMAAVAIPKVKLFLTADRIEKELQERYMELPVDADGEPIHVGDNVFSKGSLVGTVVGIGYHNGPRIWTVLHNKSVTAIYDPVNVTHNKTATLYDIIAGFGTDVAESGSYPCREDIEECISKIQKAIEAVK